MKILNVGCGNVRVQSPEWTNLDNLRTQLPLGTGARANLDKEENYYEWDLARYQMPFPDDEFDAILCAHLIEHFPTPKAVSIMKDCHRMLKPGGKLVVSVPDASYFRTVYPEDENANWPRLYDTTDPQNPIPTFFQAALFFELHDAVLTEDSLWCYFVRSGFSPELVRRSKVGDGSIPNLIEPHLDRLKFSLIMSATK